MLKKTLCISNLPFTTDVAAITECFAPYGAAKARIVEGRGFAFVEVDSDRCEAAMDERDGTMLEGREIQVGIAKPRMY